MLKLKRKYSTFFLIVLSASLLTFIFVFLKPLQKIPSTKTAKEYFTIPSYPNTKLTEEAKNPQDGSVSKVTLTSGDSVPQISKWYLEKYSGSQWQLDFAPADTNDPNLQYIKLTKIDASLNISLIRKDNQTQITLEYIPISGSDEENEVD